jgi:hypothetical protein
MRVGFWRRNLKERNRLEDQNVDERIKNRFSRTITEEFDLILSAS